MSDRVIRTPAIALPNQKDMSGQSKVKTPETSSHFTLFIRDHSEIDYKWSQNRLQVVSGPVTEGGPGALSKSNTFSFQIISV